MAWTSGRTAACPIVNSIVTRSGTCSVRFIAASRMNIRPSRLGSDPRYWSCRVRRLQEAGEEKMVDTRAGEALRRCPENWVAVFWRRRGGG